MRLFFFILICFIASTTTLFAQDMELTYRDGGVTSWTLVSIVTSLVLIAIVKVVREGHYQLVIKGYFGGNLAQIQRDGLKIGGATGLYLLLNYIIVCGTLFFVINLRYDIDWWTNLIIVFSPVFYFAGKLLLLRFAAVVSGEKIRLREINSLFILTPQILGLLLLPLLLVSVVRFDWIEIVSWISVVVILLLHLYRVIRSSISALQNKIPLYYIILYFCTLEILPLWLIFSYL